MKKRNMLQIVLVAILALTMPIFLVVTARAQQSSSSQYQVNEVFFGSGGLNTCDGVDPLANEYCALVTAGELTVGNTASEQFQAYGGFNTDRAPFIELNTLQPFVDLGVIEPDTTGFGTAEFQVKAYLTHGYVVQLYGDTPTYGTKSIPALTATSASTAGAEQFGVNLAVNTDPANFGAAPEHDPDATFAFGEVATDNGYGTANAYKYISGDVIARSLSSTSFTKFTISYIMNISGATPAGTYLTNHSLVATATY